MAILKTPAAPLKVGQTVPASSLPRQRLRYRELARLMDDLAQGEWTVIEADVGPGIIGNLKKSEHFDSDRFEVRTSLIDGVRYLLARRLP